jgi:hypothetical protein
MFTLMFKKPSQDANIIQKLEKNTILLLSVRSLLYLILYKLEKIPKNMSQLDDSIATLTSTVAAQTTEVHSAAALIRGIPDLIAAAVAKAIAAGATPEQLQAITDLGTALTANTAELTDAVVANTPSAPPVASDPTPVASDPTPVASDPTPVASDPTPVASDTSTPSSGAVS